MDPITISALVTSAWNLLAPFAKNAAGKLIEKSDEELPEVVAGKVWDAVKEKMEAYPETKSQPADLVKTPDNLVVQGAFQYQLQKLLEKDQAFADQLEKLVNEAKQVTTYNATLPGDGAIAQGNGAKAVGKGGVYIGGKASGNTIITGDHNSVESKKKNKK